MNTRSLEEGAQLLAQSAETAVQDGAAAISNAFTPLVEGARAVQDGIWSGVSAVARSVSRSFSTGPSYSRRQYDRMEEDDRKEWKDMKKEYQKLQWSESMERNLAMLKQIMEHRRNELHIADMSNDQERRRALEAELKDLKVRQARLSCALWIQPEDLPSSQTLLEMRNPKKLQAELEAKLVELGLVEARALQRPPVPTPTKADASTSPNPEVSQPQPEPVRLVPKLPLSRPVAATEDGRFQPVLDPRFTKASDPATSPFSDDSPCKTRNVQGARPHTPRRKATNAGGQDTESGDTGGKLIDGSHPDGGTGSTTSPLGGKGKGDGGKRPGKGSGKKGPAAPAKGGKPAADGDGKGMKGPPGKGGRIRKVTPLGRRFHWKELNAEKVKGTVFDKADSPMMDTIDVQFDGLKNYFADDDELSKQGAPAAQQSQEMVRVFDNTRMQNIAIVMRGIFGQMPLAQDMDFLAAGIEAVDPARAGPMAPSLRDGEKISLLPTAMPTDEEAQQLREHDPDRLRQVERLVLPLAQLTRCPQRIRALRLAAQAEMLHDNLQGRLENLQNACDALRDSMALRRFLRTVAKLGSWINSSDPEMEKGFAVSSALGKLRLFRAVREDKAVSLLHIAILAAAGAEVPVVQRLCSSLALELEALDRVAREDLADLEQAIRQFAAEEAWLLQECEHAEYSLGVRARLRAVHQEQLLHLRQQLEEAYGLLQPRLSETLSYFAEGQTPSVEAAAEQLLKTLHAFKKDVASASAEILAQPRRFLKAYAAGAAAEAAAEEQRATQRVRARSMSGARVSVARRNSRPGPTSLADRVVMQKSLAAKEDLRPTDVTGGEMSKSANDGGQGGTSVT